MNYPQAFLFIVANVGFTWWIVNGEQRFLENARNWWFARFPVFGMDPTIELSDRAAERQAVGGEIVFPHPLGKPLACDICAAFWLGTLIGAAMFWRTGEVGWLLVGFGSAGLASR